MHSSLLPRLHCPFCGHAETEIVSKIITFMWSARVVCLRCGAHGGDCSDKDTEEEVRNLAVQTWNGASTYARVPGFVTRANASLDALQGVLSMLISPIQLDRAHAGTLSHTRPFTSWWPIAAHTDWNGYIQADAILRGMEEEAIAGLRSAKYLLIPSVLGPTSHHRASLTALRVRWNHLLNMLRKTRDILRARIRVITDLRGLIADASAPSAPSHIALAAPRWSTGTTPPRPIFLRSDTLDRDAYIQFMNTILDEWTLSKGPTLTGILSTQTPTT